MISLPRQARDKHRESSTQKDYACCFLTAGGGAVLHRLQDTAAAHIPGGAERHALLPLVREREGETSPDKTIN
jgi:hypothetical protein